MPDDLSRLILGLSAAETPARERAAAEIFERGMHLALPVIVNWLADRDMAATFAIRNPNFLQSTVGLAVTGEHFEAIRSAWGSPRLASVPPDQDAMEFELQCDEETRLDILTTGQPDGTGAIARFLQKSGEGIQQVEVLVHDVDRATEILGHKHGLAPVYPQTRPGADGARVNFFLVATPEGKKVLIELVEARR